MKAQYISTPGRAKKIIAAVWIVAVSLGSVAGSFVNGVKYIFANRNLRANEPSFLDLLSTYKCYWKSKTNKLELLLKNRTN